jgi:thiamine-phosphate pyrophosphorylase
MSGSGGEGPCLLARPGPEPVLLLVVNLANEEPVDVDQVEAAIRGGVTLLQVRGKGVGAGALAAGTRRLLDAARGRRVPLFVNDRLDVALACGADGVQVGPQDLPPAEVRRIAPGLFLGVSARSVDRVRRAESARADLIGAGALRGSDTKEDAVVIGVDGIGALASSTSIPVLGIGGVRPEDAPALRRAGAAGMAVASGIWDAPDPEAAARAYVEAWKSG